MSASESITKHIEGLNDWRGGLLAHLRKLVNETAPELTEEWKWDTPVWSHNGNVLAVGAFKDHMKINFFKGALLNDKKKLFNAGLEAKKTRAIDIHAGEKVDEAALRELIREAVALNAKKPKTKK
jgi:hypothetical protein